MANAPQGPRCARIPASKWIRQGGWQATNMLSGAAIYPVYASFKTTNRCGMRCKFCDIWTQKTPELDTAGVCKVLDNLASSSIMMVSLEGGDPLIRDDILDILTYAHDHPFFLFLTTNGPMLDKRPMPEICRHLDWLHISIDEGHDNLEMYESLDEYQSWGAPICVQLVVMNEHIPEMEWKIKRIHEVGARTVVMPACQLDRFKDRFPEREAFQKELSRLDKLYPSTITTPPGFLNRINQPHGCDSSSMVIDVNGRMYYPCHIRGDMAVDLTRVPLNDYLRSRHARLRRHQMAHCDRACGWYQYFATKSFVSPSEAIPAFGPYLGEILGGE